MESSFLIPDILEMATKDVKIGNKKICLEGYNCLKIRKASMEFIDVFNIRFSFAWKIDMIVLLIFLIFLRQKRKKSIGKDFFIYKLKLSHVVD